MQTNKSLAAALLILALAGCGSQGLYPERLATVQEVFPDASVEKAFSSAPLPSKSEASFDVGYADLWSIVRRSVAQNQWNIRWESESVGSLRATRTVRDQRAHGDSYKPVDRNYYFLVNVSELSGSRSRVRAIARTQAQCYQVARGAYAAMTIGLSEIYTASEQKNCKDEASKVHWADGSKSVKPDLDNLIVLIRNNLIAAGLE